MSTRRSTFVVALLAVVLCSVGCAGEVVGMDPPDAEVVAPPDAAVDARPDVGVPPPDAATEPACPEEIIYVVSQEGDLLQYNPQAKRFTPVGPLECDGPGQPYSMAVSRDGLAYVLYYTQPRSQWRCAGLYTVDTITGSCLGATPFSCENDAGIGLFGMGFGHGGPDPSGETLYAIGRNDQHTILAWIDRQTYHVERIAVTTQTAGDSAELAYLSGSGLWVFFGYAGPPFLARIDTSTGWLLEELELPVDTAWGAHAVASWGGEGYAFFHDAGQGQVFRFGSGYVTLHDTFPDPIVGAGNAPCP